MKKIFIVLLFILFINIIACAENDTITGVTDNNVNTAEPSVTILPYDDEITDDFDFNGYEFTIAMPLPESLGAEKYVREETNGDTINDAIYYRNMDIEERFKISISTLSAGWSGTQAKDLSPYILAGDDEIDLIAVTFAESAKNLLTGGYLMRWNDIPYINLEKAYWNRYITETASIKDNIYFIAGDINWSMMENTYLMYFNKTVAENFSVGDIYETVRSGKWTLDELIMLTSDFSNDTNGDSKFDENDTYAICYNSNFYSDVFLTAFNVSAVEKGENEPVLNIMTDKMQNIADKLYSLFHEKNRVYAEAIDDVSNNKSRTIFFDNRALFWFDVSSRASSYRAEEIDFGIIPFPKYDENQANYQTISDQWGMVCAIPITATDTGRTGVITEAMCASSLKYIVPAYYDIILTGKSIRDVESEEMLDIIFDGIIYIFKYFVVMVIYFFIV
jgi:hypothetical protein